MPSAQSAVSNHEYRNVAITVLVESASNPRKRFDEKSIEELAAYVPRHINLQSRERSSPELHTIESPGSVPDLDLPSIIGVRIALVICRGNTTPGAEARSDFYRLARP